MSLPSDDKTRKGLLLFQGLFKYFPHALAAVAESSRVANEQHNPGEAVHWAKEKSRDELDSLLRHLTDIAVEPNHRDPDGIMAAVKLAWRALANLERMHDAGVDIFHLAPATKPLKFAVPTPPTLQDYCKALDELVEEEEPPMITGVRNSIDDCTINEWTESSRAVLGANQLKP